MGPNDLNKQTPKLQAPPPPAARRMDPRMWALLPVVALFILGAYFLGKHYNQQESVAPLQAAPVVQPPPEAPKGKMLVTEVPRALTVTPVLPPTATNTPKAAGDTSFKREEPAVVLPTPADTTAPDANTDNADGADSNAQPEHGDATNSEPDRDPEKINDPALEYPSAAYEEGAQGTARVSFRVTTTGSVEDARIDDSSGDNRLDQAALDYVHRLKFRPAIRDGKTVSLQVTRSVPFSLK